MNHLSPTWRKHCALHMAKRYRSIGHHRPIIGAAYFMDKENDLLHAAKRPTAAISGPYKKDEPPIWIQALLGILIAATLVTACFL